MIDDHERRERMAERHIQEKLENDPTYRAAVERQNQSVSYPDRDAPELSFILIGWGVVFSLYGAFRFVYSLVPKIELNPLWILVGGTSAVFFLTCWFLYFLKCHYPRALVVTVLLGSCTYLVNIVVNYPGILEGSIEFGKLTLDVGLQILIASVGVYQTVPLIFSKDTGSDREKH